MTRDRDYEPLPPQPALAFAHAIPPAPLAWLWPHRIPHAQLTLLVGEPGAGKSLLAIDLAARISTGRPWPDQPTPSPALALPAPPDTPLLEHPAPPSDTDDIVVTAAESDAPPTCDPPSPPRQSDLHFPWQPNPFFAYDPPPPGAPPQPGAAIIASAEDHPAEVLIPRLQAAGANLNRIAILYGVHPQPDRRDSVSRLILPDHFQALEGAVCRTPGARLLILDPLHAFLSPAACGNPAILTSLLNRLADYARIFNLAILAVAHLSKCSRARTFYRVRGSVPLVATARAAHLLTADPDDPDRRLLVPFKSVHALRPPPLAFRITAAPPPDPSPDQFPDLPPDLPPDPRPNPRPELELRPDHRPDPRPVPHPDQRRDLRSDPRPDQRRDLRSDPRPVPRLEWTPTPSNYADRLASDLLDADPDAYSALSEACNWLTTYLLDGPRPAADLIRDSRTAGLCLRTLKTAKRLLRIRSRRALGGPGWLWVADQN
jgi:hypothetical protein